MPRDDACELCSGPPNGNTGVWGVAGGNVDDERSQAGGAEDAVEQNDTAGHAQKPESEGVLARGGEVGSGEVDPGSVRESTANSDNSDGIPPSASLQTHQIHPHSLPAVEAGDAGNAGDDGGGMVRYFEFAFHSAVNETLKVSGGVGGGRQLELQHIFGDDLPAVLDCGFFASGSSREAMKQTGVVRINCIDCSLSLWRARANTHTHTHTHTQVRINCMDCLDRTNVAMSLLGRTTFVRQLQSLNALTADEALAMETGAAACYTAVQDELVGLWTRHGDALSLQVSWRKSLVLMYECVAVRVQVCVLASG